MQNAKSNFDLELYFGKYNTTNQEISYRNNSTIKNLFSSLVCSLYKENEVVKFLPTIEVLDFLYDLMILLAKKIELRFSFSTMQNIVNGDIQIIFYNRTENIVSISIQYNNILGSFNVESNNFISRYNIVDQPFIIMAMIKHLS